MSRQAQAAVARAAAGMPPWAPTSRAWNEAKPGLRANTSSAPNLHFTVPRKADVAYLAACGFMKNRLPIQWELLQPMLHDTVANAAAKAAIGNPGAFHAGYEAFITGVLDAHAAAGTRCIIDNHNYGRYQDFRFQADGSVIGLTVPPGSVLRPYTTDAVQIQSRIFSLVPGATLKIAHFTDFWTRAATKWKNHPGFGGYGLMNEPHDMPKPGGVIASNEEAVEGRRRPHDLAHVRAGGHPGHTRGRHRQPDLCGGQPVRLGHGHRHQEPRLSVDGQQPDL